MVRVGPDTSAAAPNDASPTSSSKKKHQHLEHMKQVAHEKAVHMRQRHHAHKEWLKKAKGKIQSHKPSDHHADAYYGVESMSYARPDTEASDRLVDLEMNSLAKRLLTRFAPLFIIICLGLIVGCIVNLILAASNAIEKWKVALVIDRVAAGNWGAAFWTWLGFGLVGVTIAFVCVLISPHSQASGIPGILAFLNGAAIPLKENVFGMAHDALGPHTGFFKSVSVIAAVASGLFVGPEGPLIHIGAVIGRQVIHLLHMFTGSRSNKLLSILSAGKAHVHTENWFHVDAEQRRDFVAIGAGAAIAAAFSAPLAGVLFVIEEAATKITVRLLELAFLACACAFIVTWSIKNTASGGGHVKFDKPLLSFCTLYGLVDFIVFLILAILGGIIGAAFNHIVYACNHFRAHHVNPFTLRRCLELLVLIVITCVVSIWIPYAWECTDLKPQLMMEGSVGCLQETSWVQLSSGLMTEADAYKAYTQPGSDWATVNGTSRLSTREQEYITALGTRNGTKLTFLARPAESVPFVDFNYAHHGDCGVAAFNEMATLMLRGGVKSVSMLLTRGVPHLFSAWSLIVAFFLYFFFAAYTSGTSVAAGLFIPHLLIGGTLGRLVGLLYLKVVTAICIADLPGVDPANMSVLEWTLSGYRTNLSNCVVPDPGTFAMIGAAAVMSGSGRITVFLAVVMLELTGDLQFMPVIAIASVVAMWTGNLINHGLYHSLMHLLGVPFMDPNPHDLQTVHPVETIMAAHPLHCANEKMTVASVRALLAREGGDDDSEEAKATLAAAAKYDAVLAAQFAGVSPSTLPPSQPGPPSTSSTTTVASAAGATSAPADAAGSTTSPVSPANTDAAVATQPMAPEAAQSASSWLQHMPAEQQQQPSPPPPPPPANNSISVGHGVDIDDTNGDGVNDDGTSGALTRDDDTTSEDGIRMPKHSGFPVVDNEHTLHGIIERDQLTHIIAKIEKRVRMEIDGIDAETAAMHAFAEADAAGRADEFDEEADTMSPEARAAVEGTVVNLAEHMQRAPFIVFHDTSVARAYDMFRDLGLRHLCVINRFHGKLVGLVTRKDLMPWRLEDKLGLHHDHHGWAPADAAENDHHHGHGHGHGGAGDAADARAGFQSKHHNGSVSVLGRHDHNPVSHQQSRAVLPPISSEAPQPQLPF